MRWLAALGLLLLLPAVVAQPQPDNLEGVTRALWRQSGDALREFSSATIPLKQSIDLFLQAPSAETLEATRQQWYRTHNQLVRASSLIGVRQSYPALFDELDHLLARVDRHPIAPGFLDYLSGYPHAGLVNDIGTPINRETLMAQHGLTADQEATLGLHVLEFLLFGENGERTVEDYRPLEGNDQLDAHERANNRRRQLLALVAQLLADEGEMITADGLGQKGPSPLSRPYLALPAASRIPLWRQAIAQRLQALARTSDHCQFAPGGCPHTALALGAMLDDLDGSASLAYLIATDADAWMAQASQLRQTLQNQPEPPTLASQLNALAEPFED